LSTRVRPRESRISSEGMNSPPKRSQSSSPIAVQAVLGVIINKRLYFLQMIVTASMFRPAVPDVCNASWALMVLVSRRGEDLEREVVRQRRASALRRSLARNSCDRSRDPRPYARENGSPTASYGGLADL
jgi:hypothetical protein